MLCEVVSKLGADSFDLPRQLLPLPDLARKIEGDSACRVTIESAFLLNYFLIFFFYSGFIIAAFVFNDYLDMGVKGVLTAVSNVNNSLVEIQSKVI